MSIDKDYEVKILKMVVDEYLNQIVFPTKESLNALENNSDRVVWDLATKIYKESGHKVELCMVRNIVDLRIIDLKYQLEKLETEKKARAEREAELARKARAEAEIKAELERKARAEAEMKALEAEREALANNLQEIGGEDVSRAKVFVKLRKIISEELSVNESKVTLNSHLSNDLGADGHNLYGLVIALEEEFDIEIPDSVAQEQLHIDYPYSNASLWNMSSGSYYSSDGGGGANCIVENFLDYICAKTSV